MQEKLQQLCSQAREIAKPGQFVNILDGFDLYAVTEAGAPVVTLYEPVACIVLQGSMEVIVGDSILHYAPGSCFVGSIDLPVAGQITKASLDEPYMAISIALHRDHLADLVAQAPDVDPDARKGFAVGPAPDALFDACQRLLALKHAPEDVAVMGALLEKEILYRLLRGPQAAALHQIVASDPKIAQVRRALNWIRNNIDQSVPIGDMANCAGMSPASFRRHFRNATGMSPLQYQKTLRLQAARRAILAGAEVGRAAFDVGYESASQFSREYTRLFGLAPSYDAKRLQASGTDAA
ncbi:AraC family transcriptional regulator [Thalassospira sp.]|uniref:AraC family transcriptional regulator n=1 Tax=Thalassospira sp. TaxID=1912094 RepID=UPI000C3E7E64|nr:AraC family transcriptional regulator [Thalassospira sp.]MBC06862.1 AraC family transcriptional regulator [Thalassospira sp.]|tara:strand:+ start:7339 stop:8223 length:885 start_codon:yes stop_codon:yes gene_type:complete